MTTIVCDTTTYPGAIARACAALDEAPAFKDLPDGYLRIVVRIVKKINLARLSAPIYARRATLAAEAGKSEATVTRAIRWLEAKGMIAREQQAAPGLKGSNSPIHPTRALLDALGLTGQPKPAKLSTTPPVSGDASVSAPPTVLGKEEQPASRQPFVRIEGKTIPGDLAWLAGQGVKATGILQLMKQAKTKGQRLSLIVKRCRQYLRPLHGAVLYAYLRKLVKSDQDFGYQEQEEAKERARQALYERAREYAVSGVGQRFVTPNGEVEVVIEPGAMLRQWVRGVEQWRSIDGGFIEALDKGWLVLAPAPQSIVLDLAAYQV